MYRPRFIPTLLLNKDHLVKSTNFKNYHYIGDPINAVRIFNDLKADELAFLDIAATQNNSLISLDFIKEVGEEANMPFSVGGGIKTLKDIQDIISSGAEKVIIGSAAAADRVFIPSAVREFGSSTICVCIDVKKNFWGQEKVYIKNAKSSTNYKPEEYAKLLENEGVGEIIIQSVEKDGTMAGYDIELVKRISEVVTIPVVALGGAGKKEDFRNCFQNTHANGFGAGSFFIYQGSNKGVLISYLDDQEKLDITSK